MGCIFIHLCLWWFLLVISAVCSLVWRGGGHPASECKDENCLASYSSCASEKSRCREGHSFVPSEFGKLEDTRQRLCLILTKLPIFSFSCCLSLTATHKRPNRRTLDSLIQVTFVSSPDLGVSWSIWPWIVAVSYQREKVYKETRLSQVWGKL